MSSGPAPPTRPFALRTVDIGVRLTFLAATVAIVTPFLPGTSTTDPLEFALLDAGTVLLAVLVWRAPWDRWLGTRVGSAALEAWGVGLVLIVAAAVGLAGEPDGEGHLYYYLIVVYFALVLEGGALLRLLGVTAVGLTALSMSAGLPPARIVTRIGVLILLSYLARAMRTLLSDRTSAAERAMAESDRRAALLATVAGSARNLASLDPESMIERLVHAAVSLGFETGNVCRFDQHHETYEVVAPVGHAWADYTVGAKPADLGMPGLVLESRAPVVVEDYANHPRAIPGMRDQGYRAVVALPIWVGGRLDGCLVVGTRTRETVRSDEVESLELLAALAGRALENSLRFEKEQEESQRLARLAQMKSDFVSNVSHELRTPLTVVEGIGRTLEDRHDVLDDDLRRELVARLNANADSLHDIVTRLLDFSRIEAGTLEVCIDEVKLCELSETVVERMAGLLSGHELDVRIDKPLPVRADPVLVERVLENLLSNAAKHTPPGTVVSYRATRLGPNVRVEVADEGPGIPPDELAHLTERFFRGGDPNTRTRKGLGLGLALVSELLAMHDRRLEVRSVLGEGTSFAFELPSSVDAPRLSGRYDADLDPARSGLR